MTQDKSETEVKKILQDMMEELIDAVIALRAMAGAKPARSVTVMLLEDPGFILLTNQAFVMKDEAGDVLDAAVAAVSRRPCWRAAKPHFGAFSAMAERQESHFTNHQRAALLPIASALLKEGASQAGE